MPLYFLYLIVEEAKEKRAEKKKKNVEKEKAKMA